MPFTEGVFSAGDFGTAIALEQEILADGSRMKELDEPIIGGSAILMNQNPTIIPQFDGTGKRCIKARIVTMRGSNGFAANKILTCTPTAGPKGGSEGKDVIKEVLINPFNFTVQDDSCENVHDYNAKYAYMSLYAKVQIEVALSKFLIGLAASNADTPSATWFETPGTVVGDTFEVTTANFKSELIADVLAGSIMNKMTKPIILNGRNFFNKKVLAEFEGGGCCTTNAVLNSNQYFQYYWDLLNVDQQLGGAYTLAIDNNSLYFWSSPNYTNTVPELRAADTYTWSEPLPRLKYMANGVMNDIFVDVKAKKYCTVVDGIETWGMNFEYVVRGAAGANLPNADGKKGIVKVKKVA